MEILVLGVSHRTAPVALREKLAFPSSMRESALHALCRLPAISEALLLSTCNRVELITAAHAPQPGLAAVRRFFAESRGADPEILAAHVYEHRGAAAVRHVFRVASSLDSMIVGEPQILGQVKDAYGAAQEAGTLGSLLDRCLTRSFAVAKRVRTETGVAAGAASVSSVAVDLAERIYGRLEGRLVLVIGAGEMADLAARHLRAAGAADLWCVNRTYERAIELAERVEGRARRWEELDRLLATVDIVISSVGAPQPILTVESIARAMKARRRRSLFLIDIAVPRGIEAAVGDLENVFRFDMDDLEKVVADNLRERRKEAQRAERMVEAEAREFMHWVGQQAVVPVIKQLRERFVSVARGEVQRTLQALPELAESERRQLEAMADAIVGKLLHGPLTALRRQSGAEGEQLCAAARRLFDLVEIPAPAAATSSPAETVEPEQKVS
jgi:glutamyl-tRNA reductase